MKLAAFLFAGVAGASALRVEEPLLGTYLPTDRVVSKDEAVSFTVALPSRNLDKLQEFILKVSDPTHKSFGKYMTREEVNEFTAPSPADYTRVEKWMKRLDVVTERHLDTIKCTTTVGRASTLFNATFHEIRDTVSDDVRVQAGAYIVPGDIASSVSAVFGLHGLPLPKTEPIMPSAPPSVGVKTLVDAYNVTGVTPTGSASARQAVAEFQGQFMQPSDLKAMFWANNLPADDAVVYKYHGNNHNGNGIEAQLDIQFIMGVAVGVKTDFYEQANMNFCSDLKAWAGLIMADSNAPWVHSVSYGWQGDMSQLGCQPSQIQSVDADFQKMAASGHSIIFASGDSGSAYANGVLWPSWPASSPWVTSVGATRFKDDVVGAPEVAVGQEDGFGSGGGFSKDFPVGTWQKAAVQSYLTANAATLPSKTAVKWYPDGRATPDVSALGTGYAVYNNGAPMNVGGTSASTPTFAAMIGLINDARIAAGKKPMGFLNQFIYQNQDAFTDVTEGSDKIGRGGPTLPYGFECAKGWDPVTGVGTPIFTALNSKAQALP